MSDDWNAFYTGKRVLVTGGAGMTGAVIVQQLLSASPTVQVRATWNHMPPDFNDQRLEWVQADLTSRDACRAAVSGVDAAILTAAVTGGARALTERPETQVTDNLIIDALLFEALAAAGVPRCVFFSTASLYQPLAGNILEDQLDRNEPPHPAHRGIGFVKRASEQLCQFWHERSGLACGILRAANIYGPRAAFDPARSNFIPALIRKATDRLDPFEVWGSADIVRDVIFVTDAAAAAVRLLAVADLGYETYNLGTGSACTVGDVVRAALQAVSHTPSSVVYSETGPVTVRSRVIDSKSLQQRLGWEPVVPLEQGVRQTLLWWTKYKDSWTK
jgi:GDP-L-fucose synthase